MSVRRANNDDYEKIIELYTEFTGEEYTIGENNFFNFIGAHRIYVIESLEGIVIGCATFFTEKKLIHNLSWVAHIEDVIISSSYRGQGYGKVLIKHLIAKAEEEACYKVILNCSDDVRPFYETCGFQEKNLQMAVYF